MSSLVIRNVNLLIVVDESNLRIDDLLDLLVSSIRDFPFYTAISSFKNPFIDVLLLLLKR